MLRGSARHDGIPNNQAARERQRERQRQERAQMLPNEDNDITASTLDLFESPVKVDPGTEDQTSVEIKKQFGNFDSVRHILESPSSSRRLIGVDQNTVASNSASRSSGNTTSSNNLLAPKAVGGQQHPRSSTNPPNSNNNSKQTQSSRSSTGTTNQQISTTAPAQSTTVAPGFRSTFVPVTKSLNVAGAHQASPSVPSPVPVPSHLSGNSNSKINQSIVNVNSSSNFNTNYRNLNNSESGHSANVPPPVQSHQTKAPLFSSSTHATAVRKPNNYIHNNIASKSTSNNLSVLETNVSSKGSSVESTNVFQSITPKIELSEEKFSGNSSNTVVNNSSITSIDTNKPIKSEPNDGFIKKPPVLERTDSHIELENMLKEMMDVKTPISAIQTPGSVNETPTKKITQRRSSKGEDIVQSLHESGMTSIPSPVKKMDSSGDSSSSYESDSESDSEDSSSCSMGGGGYDKLDNLSSQPATTSSPTRNWDLSSFITMGNNSSNSIKVESTSQKDITGRDSLHSNIDSEESPGEIPLKADSNVSSTSLFGKSNSPLEISNVVPGKSPRRMTDVRLDSSYIPVKPPPPIIPAKGTSTGLIKSKGASLSESSSEDEEKLPAAKDTVNVRPIATVRPIEEKRPISTPKKRRKSLSSSPERNVNAMVSSDAKNKPKKGQDRNKNDSIRNVFRIKNTKVNSPTSAEMEKEAKGSPIVLGKGKPNAGKGKLPSKPVAGNRVSAKDSGKKNVAKPAIVTPVSQNGNLEVVTTKKTTSPSDSKKKEPVKKNTVSVPTVSKRPNKAQQNPVITVTPSTSSMLPPVSVNRKDDFKPSLTHNSSLICKIPLSKLTKRPRLLTTTSVPQVKSEKTGPSTVSAAKEDSSRVRLHYDSSRVGSSSDHANDRDLLNLSDASHESAAIIGDKSKKQAKRSRKITSSQKKGKLKDNRVKLEDDSDLPEISSNVPGYSNLYDSSLVSTTRNPIEMDVAQAPDSSLNPSHLQSPIVPQRAIYLSYFEKVDHSEDEESMDQDSYLETAKGLKHKADKEECGGLTQVFTYLESGLYFILTGIAIEKERPLPAKEAYTMYKDTLHLIRYIGNRFRSRSDSLPESKIMVLGLRCQALLSLKLYRMKSKESKEINLVMQEHFQKTPPSHVDLAHSPQLSTPSPRSPTSSPASSFLSLTPSPHHPYQNHHQPTISRNLYAQIFKFFTNSGNLMNALDTWEVADNLVERMHIEDFFTSLDRIYGPLTLHSTLVDLVRYVKHGIRVLKSNSDVS